MVIKVNIATKDGKTFRKEFESVEPIFGKAIGEKVDGSDVFPDLAGYSLEIKGTSDIAGLPGMKGETGVGIRRKLLTRGFGMKQTEKGMKRRKTLRGEMISDKTAQINFVIAKQGGKKLEEIFPDQNLPKPKVEEKVEAPVAV